MTIHVVPAIARESSGPTYAVTRLCEAVIAAGEEVVLATCDFDPLPAPPPFVRRFPPAFGPRRLTRAPSLNRWLRAQVRGGRTGIVHSHGLWRMSAVYAARAVRGGRARLVVSPHGTLSPWAMRHGRRRAKRLFWAAFQRRALTRAACFRATSDQECDDIRRLGFRQPVAVIPNGVDLPPMHPAARARHRTLLFLGRLHPVKGVDLLIEAWAAVQDAFPRWRLVIAGDDADYQGTSGYMAELRRLAAARGAARVSFAGELTGAAKWDAYRGAALYVLPSRSENFGVTVAEALAAGTPVIASDRTPWRRLHDRGAGWCVETGAAPLAARLREALAADDGALRRMGMRGRRWMEEDFSWADIGRRMAATVPLAARRDPRAARLGARRLILQSSGRPRCPTSRTHSRQVVHREILSR